MFSFKNVPARFFELEAPDNGQLLHLEPPKLKTLNKLTAISKDAEATPEEMAEIVAKIISKSKEGREIDAETVMEWLDSDQLAKFAEAFLGWLNNTKEADPN